MQAGLFVGAEDFCASICSGIFTHYKEEEDASMTSGKLDEELARMSAIVEEVRPRGLVLCNDSFGSTNEREGSEIARQIVSALRESDIRVIYVTHMYELAHGFYDRHEPATLFLRAERLPDGTRTFRMEVGAPLETSYGADLYQKIFGCEPQDAPQGAERPMSADSWKSILALAVGSAIGFAIQRSLALLFRQSERLLSISSVAASSILGGSSGAVVGYVMVSDVSKEMQSILTFGLLGIMVTVAADATAAQASLGSPDAARVRKRIGVHVAIGVGAALIGIGIVSLIVDALS